MPVSTDRDAATAFLPPAPASTATARLSRAWLLLGVSALAASGLFAILIVAARTPGLGERIPWADFFHTALVVHVDLSVLIWFLAFAGALWCVTGSGRAAGAGWAALLLCALGTLMISAAPFTGAGQPFMNNYVPVLRQPFFLAGLGVFGAGFALLAARTLLANATAWHWSDARDVARFGLYAAAVVALLSIALLLWSFVTVGDRVDGVGYYEVLFWSGGHALQFAHTLLLLVVWLWLAQASGARFVVAPRVVALLLALTAAPVLLAPLLQAALDPVSGEFRQAFTELMRWGGLGALPLGLIVAWGVMRAPQSATPERAALVASLVLFTAGGVLGFLIRGVNVVIPAHYHGSIVGVTLAFMGCTYLLLSRLGYGAVPARLARTQAWIYGGGQLLHILGLAWSGGYGVARKTAGAAQALDDLPRVLGMGMMGLGGLIAIIGGLLFVIVVWKSVRVPRAG
jgi:cytochrome c oxidase subunit I